ncbi:YybS family protein [Neobacillus dielmonensis]|uniref:YybS family protein n=1 Tax=Neobacillus dielmonensis TaxID=1347369 RepID=UPI000A4C6834|nr:YybS family protein [Neobacillus dielmonensis]
MKNARLLTEGAMLLAVFAVLLLITIYVPLIGMIVNLFLAVPFIIFAAKNDWKITIVFVIASLFISMIVGSLTSLPLALAYGTTGAVIGYLIQKKKDRVMILLVASLVFLVNIIGVYAVSVAFFKVDIIKQMMDMMEESLTTSADLLKNLGQGAEADKTVAQYKKALSMISTLIPTLFVISSVVISYITQLVSFPIVKRFGIEVQKWKPFKDLSLPKSILWYLLITLTASLLLHPEQGTYLHATLLNLTYILQFLMMFQGYTFLFYFFDLKGISKSVSVVLVIASFIIPIFLYIIGILGIIDLGFDMRKKLGKNSL